MDVASVPALMALSVLTLTVDGTVTGAFGQAEPISGSYTNLSAGSKLFFLIAGGQINVPVSSLTPSPLTSKDVGGTIPTVVSYEDLPGASTTDLGIRWAPTTWPPAGWRWR